VTLRALMLSVGLASACCCGFSLSDPHDPRSNEQPPSGSADINARKMPGTGA